jgi:catechol 2,3-dioxygenase-like lactoylglutathione lyase family enzyme
MLRFDAKPKEEASMSDMTIVEIKAFVPARDFALSKQFYHDLGFTIVWSSDDLAYVRHGNASFLLQNFYEKTHAENFMMHLLVEDVDAWWHHVETQGLLAKYSVFAERPALRPWGLRDFPISDPTGVLWRIAQTLPERPASEPE